MGEKQPTNFTWKPDFHIISRGSSTCRKSATWDRRIYFPSEGRHTEDFFTWKIWRLRPGLNPRSWVPEASTLTTRPLKPLYARGSEVHSVSSPSQTPSSSALTNEALGTESHQYNCSIIHRRKAAADTCPEASRQQTPVQRLVDSRHLSRG
jgi:hypothetical protein